MFTVKVRQVGSDGFIMPGRLLVKNDNKNYECQLCYDENEKDSFDTIYFKNVVFNNEQNFLSYFSNSIQKLFVDSPLLSPEGEFKITYEWIENGDSEEKQLIITDIMKIREI